MSVLTFILLEYLVMQCLVIQYLITQVYVHFCHTRTQLTISDHLILIPDDQLGPLVALKSFCNRPTDQPAGLPQE